jgi:endonuclease III
MVLVPKCVISLYTASVLYQFWDASMSVGQIFVVQVHQLLEKAYPDARPGLNYGNSFELLIAVILSAQTTDKQVNQVTPGLFAAYPTAQQMSRGDIITLERLLGSIGLYHTKARAIRQCAQRLEENFKGVVPQGLAELMSLSGVGRKTANVVLAQAFGLDSGIAVDTHVKRIAFRLGLTNKTDPDKVADELEAVFPRALWHRINVVWVLHGRRICVARKPKCGECQLVKLCPRDGVLG